MPSVAIQHVLLGLCQGRVLCDFNDRIKLLSTNHTKSNSKDSYILRYGETLGILKYEEKNKMCAVTLDNLIAKYGIMDGTCRWEHYTQTLSEKNSKDYVINTKGELAWDELCAKKKSFSREALVDLYGEAEGERLYIERSENMSHTMKRSVKSKEFHEKDDVKPNQLKYWLRRGYSEESAKEKVKERQSTNLLSRFVSRYGEDVGRAKWEERQLKWQRTLNSKPLAEREEINRKKLSTPNCISKAEQELFNSLSREFPNIRQQKYLCGDSFTCSFDMVLADKLIEYNGTYWHCDPNSYQPDFFNKSKQQTAASIWEYDKRKISLAESKGYTVLVIWEAAWNDNKAQCIEKCKTFLQN
jgi:G:T-mismatch repair DNA endonuclease (very short patch repair protein)